MEKSFICPLSQKVFSEPVMADDGYIYEKAEIQKWLLMNNTSPITNAPISACIKSNPTFDSIFDSYLKLNPNVERYPLKKKHLDHKLEVVDIIENKKFDKLKDYIEFSWVALAEDLIEILFKDIKFRLFKYFADNLIDSNRRKNGAYFVNMAIKYGTCKIIKYLADNSSTDMTADNLTVKCLNGDVAVFDVSDNKLSGNCIIRDINGGIYQYTYVNDERHGTAIEKDPNGKINKYHFTNGKIHGRYVQKYPCGIIGIYNCLDGEFCGKFTETNSNGIITEGYYLDSYMEGSHIKKFPNGDTLKSHFVRGTLHGIQIEKFIGGNVRQCTYRNGYKNGLYISKKSRSIFISYYDDDILDSIYIKIYQDSDQIILGEYIDGKISRKIIKTNHNIKDLVKDAFDQVTEEELATIDLYLSAIDN